MCIHTTVTAETLRVQEDAARTSPQRKGAHPLRGTPHLAFSGCRAPVSCRARRHSLTIPSDPSGTSFMQSPGADDQGRQMEMEALHRAVMELQDAIAQPCAASAAASSEASLMGGTSALLAAAVAAANTASDECAVAMAASQAMAVSGGFPSTALPATLATSVTAAAQRLSDAKEEAHACEGEVSRVIRTVNDALVRPPPAHRSQGTLPRCARTATPPEAAVRLGWRVL
jgi:hypothetical protein